MSIKYTKEQKIEILKKFIENNGGCAEINCGQCYAALFNEPKTGSCSRRIPPLKKNGEKSNEDTRLRLAKERLAKLTSVCSIDDEETIILDQNN